MYSKIQQEKTQGFSRDAVSRHLHLSWNTIDRYWDMTIEEYESIRYQHFKSKLDKHRDLVVSWLESYPDVSASQIKDWLQEHYDEVFIDRTVRDYVQRLRITCNLPKSICPREYGYTPELPPGQQLQADFGMYHALREGSRRVTLHFAIFILAHSRYKHVVWQDRPFTSIDFVRSLESCFEAMGGTPKELVIDQDRLMVVHENHGDILYTFEFERCKNRHGFMVWLCRKADPESKGLVESGVKFIKYNFARHRTFVNLTLWSQDCQDWLARTGNGKIHAETKKIPAEVFASEKAHLKPVISFAKDEPRTDRIPTPVRKNNTIRFNASRYSVPIGTYTLCQSVFVQVAEDHLEIYDAAGIMIASHPLTATAGELIVNTSHRRDTSAKVRELFSEAMTALGNTPQAEMFLLRIQKARKRYFRDQLQLILAAVRKYDPGVIRRAVLACVECESDSAADLRDFAEHLFHQITLDDIAPAIPLKLMSDGPAARILHIKVDQHAPSVYQKRIGKGGA